MNLSIVKKSSLSRPEAKTLTHLASQTLFYEEKQHHVIDDFVLKNYFSDNENCYHYILNRNNLETGVVTIESTALFHTIKIMFLHPKVQGKLLAPWLLNYVLSELDNGKPIFIKTSNPRSASVLSALGFTLLSDRLWRVLGSTIDEFASSNSVDIHDCQVPFRQMSSYPWRPLIQKSSAYQFDKKIAFLKGHFYDRLVFVKSPLFGRK